MNYFGLILAQTKNTNRKIVITHQDFRWQELYSMFIKNFCNKQTVSSPPELGNQSWDTSVLFFFEGNISMHFPISLYKLPI